MLTELDVLRDVSLRLERAGVPFMLTGSMAMNYYAEPRMTRDIDMVVALNAINLPAIIPLFHPDYYVTEEGVAEAIRYKTMFNIIHIESVIKVDLIVQKSSPYRIEEFNRRRSISIDDFSTWIVSREDLILSKLDWLRQTNWDIQRRDIRNLLSGESDREYLRRWATELNLLDLFEEVLRA